MRENKENRSPHILNTSANLLGFCFIVLTSVKISKFHALTYIDEGAAICIIVFAASCLLSFLAMQRETSRYKKLERGADILFFFGLISLCMVTIFIAFNIIN